MLHAVPTPSPDHAGAGTDPGEEEENTKKKKEETRLAPLDVSERIVSDLNERTGSSARYKGKGIRTMIQSLLNDGWTEADFFEVHRKKAREWKGDQKMERYLVFGTLYRPSNFEKYLGQLDVGKRRPEGKQGHIQRMAEAQEHGDWSWEGLK